MHKCREITAATMEEAAEQYSFPEGCDPDNSVLFMYDFGEWDEEKDERGMAYVAGVEAFWHGQVGFEKSPEYKLTAATPLFTFDPEKEHNFKMGSVEGKVFVLVDDELCLEIKDPDPLDVNKYGKIGFEK